MSHKRKGEKGISLLALPFLEFGGLMLIFAAVIIFVGQVQSFSTEQDDLPAKLTLADTDVSGLSRAEAKARIEAQYSDPITVYYRDQAIELNPSTVYFQVNSDAMLTRALAMANKDNTPVTEFWDHIWNAPEEAYSVPLNASHSTQAIQQWLSEVAAQYDSPPTEPEPVLERLAFEGGQPGYTLDQQAALPLIEAALYKTEDRVVQLPIEETSATEAGMDQLEQLIVDYLVALDFENVAAIYIVDLQNGEELELNLDFRSGEPVYLDCEIAFAGMSTMKIGIMTEFFRSLNYVPGIGSDDYKILYDTMTQSGNTTANFMLQRAGNGNIFTGVDQLNALLNEVGLQNTFMASYYEDLAPPEYYSTPAREAARSGECVNTRPDPYMQTTTRDLTLLLDMIYQCAQNDGGILRTIYPQQITQDDCREMLLALSGNEKGSLIMAGVPTDVEVAHKHGWTYDTHGDAGIVFSPGGDYAMAIMLWADVDWYPVLQSFPLIEEISTMVFNYYNPELINEPRRGLYPDEIGLAPSN